MKILFYLFVVLFIQKINSQNLVLNPSFERYCGKYPCNWHKISGTPDLYTKNKLQEKYKSHIYNEYKGETFGKVFIGLCSTIIKKGESIQGTLKQKLDSNRLYVIKIYGMSYNFCSQGFRSVKIALTDTLLKQTENTFFYKIKFIELYKKDSSNLKKTYGWQELQSTYIAKGTEKYICISSQTDTIKSLQSSGCTMRYFDSVIVEPTSFFYNKVLSIDSLFFETGKDKISEVSFIKLNALVLQLNKDASFKIKINGHTDNVGLQKNNLILSQKRAQAVVNYLISKGISKQRLSAVGFGDSKPIADNSSEIGRAKNRRIEFELIK